ncbi:MAG TPA: TylF/MycF/NovP-related O-methyltransferase [Thermoanaerobaculia bacterium]|nr:TylF/MycF/NovP-related O-methyltransferase [Thermoanaerobaculia bacterium]
MLPAELVALAVSAGFPAREREAFPEAEPGPATELASWLVGAARTEPAARRYLFFLKSLYETFHAIEECFPRSSGGPGGVGTSPEEMLHVANHLYLLASGGVPGLLLECGCYKGFSSACLSHACAFLGRDLVVADSFAGLPPGGPGEEGYRPGDFRGRRDEVEANVRLFGRIDRVRFVEGWFRESLAGFTEPLALLWLDVDLYESARDVLDGALPALDPRGALFSHEFLPERIGLDGRIVHPLEPPGAIRDGLAARRVDHRAVHCAGWLARIDRPGSLGRGAERLVTALLPLLRDLDHRARAARQAIGLKPALVDFYRRRLRRRK